MSFFRHYSCGAFLGCSRKRNISSRRKAFMFRFSCFACLKSISPWPNFNITEQRKGKLQIPKSDKLNERNINFNFHVLRCLWFDADLLARLFLQCLCSFFESNARNSKSLIDAEFRVGSRAQSSIFMYSDPLRAINFQCGNLMRGDFAVNVSSRETLVKSLRRRFRFRWSNS